MVGAFTGPGFGTSCPCSTVHRLRLSEYRRDFESQGLAVVSRGKGEKLVVVSAHKKREDRKTGSQEKKDKNGFTRRAMLGLVALASPALLVSGARADVEAINDSEQLRLEMLQSIEKNVSSSFDTEARILNPASLSAPSLKDETSISRISVEESTAVLKSLNGNSPGIQHSVVSSPALTPAFSQPDNMKIVETAASIEESSASGNGSLGFLNGFGVVGSGILGALYWLEGRAKTASRAALEEANLKVDKAQGALESLQNKLLEQNAQSQKELTESEQGRTALSNELASAKAAAKELQLQLDNQTNVNQNLEKKVRIFQVAIGEAEANARTQEDKFMKEEQRRLALESEVKNAGVQIREKEAKIASLETALEEKENTAGELRSDLCTTKNALVETEDRIQELGKQLIVVHSSLAEREETVQHLKKSLAAALTKADETDEKLVTVRQEMNDLEQSTSERLANLNAAKEEEVRELTSKLDATSAEAKEAACNMEKLHEEIQSLEVSLSQEQAAVKQLKDELNSATQNLQLKTREAASVSSDLKSSREEVGQLKKQKKEMEAAAQAKVRTLKESLQAEQGITSQMKHELDETRTSFQASSLEVKSLSEKLKEAMSSNKKAQSELEEACQTVDATKAALNDEKKKVVSAEKQFIETQKALAREEMLVQSLRSEFSKAMDAMNDLRKHLDSLSKDLQEANVKIGSLENEKSSLQESLAKEKKASRKLKEKAAHAESELAKLVQEKEGSVSKSRKLEDELSAAEAEMLKLKEQMSLMGNVIDSAETRIGSIAQVNAEVASLVKKIDGVTSKGGQKQTIKLQIDKLKEQSKAATEITKELKNMKKLLAHFQQNLDDAELDKVEAKAALQAAMKRNAPEEDQRLASPVGAQKSSDSL